MNNALTATSRKLAHCTCGGTLRLSSFSRAGRTAAMATCRTCRNQATACGPDYAGTVRAAVVALGA